MTEHYTCPHCGRLVTIRYVSAGEPVTSVCPHCGNSVEVVVEEE